MSVYYQKPENLKYTDMAIYIDQNVYKDDVDETLIFEYLYHLAYMLASVNRMFSDDQSRSDFSLYCASDTYRRYQNPKQFQYSEDGTPKMKKITSVLNYLKSSIRFSKSRYYKYVVYNGIKQREEDKITDSASFNPTVFNHIIQSSIQEYSKVNFNFMMRDIPSTLRGAMKSCRYKPGTVMWKNVYISCLLSFLSMITLSNSEIRYINRGKVNSFDIFVRSYAKCQNDFVILYHLPDSMYNYIHTMTKQMYRSLGNQLSATLSTYEEWCSENVLQNLLYSSIKGDVISVDDQQGLD